MEWLHRVFRQVALNPVSPLPFTDSVSEPDSKVRYTVWASLDLDAALHSHHPAWSSGPKRIGRTRGSRFCMTATAMALTKWCGCSKNSSLVWSWCNPAPAPPCKGDAKAQWLLVAAGSPSGQRGVYCTKTSPCLIMPSSLRAFSSTMSIPSLRSLTSEPKRALASWA